ncbi:MAG: ADP-ribosylglycohydrolase family protein, partial [Frankia sp.]
ASTPVFLDPADRADNFSTVASPTLYPGQMVRVLARGDAGPGLTLRMYVLHHGVSGAVQRTGSDPFEVTAQDAELTWRIPAVGTAPLLRFGLLVESPTRFDGAVTVSRIDWRGAPECFRLDGVLLSSIWDTRPEPLGAWVSSAANFEADFDRTFAVSHPHGVGLATTGSLDWDDYAVSSTLRFGLHRAAGLLARSVGHRRYYAAVFDRGSRVRLIKQHDTTRTVLAAAEFPYREGVPYLVQLRCAGTRLATYVDGVQVIEGSDNHRAYRHGGAGFLIDEGTVLADGFEVRALSAGGLE